jgi:hypothetical protein
MVKYTKGKALVLPSISLKKFKPGDELPFIPLSVVRVKPELDKEGAQVVDKDGNDSVLHILPITDLRTGEEGEIVAPYMMRKGLDEFNNADDTPDSYVGQPFAAVKGEKKNRTDMWAVYPIVLETEKAAKA